MTKKILMLLENNCYPGDPRVRNEAQTLTDAGYTVMVVCPKEEGFSAYEAYKGVHVYRFPMPPEGSGIVSYLVEYGYATLAIFVTSLYVLLRRGFDAVHMHNPPDVLAFITLFYKLLGKRIVFDHHDLAPEMYEVLFDNPNRLLHGLLLRFEKMACRVADHVIVTNNSYRDLDIARNGVDPSQISVVRNGPSEKFKPIAPDTDLMPAGKTVLCYVGEMGHHDGLDYLVRALAKLKNELQRDDFFALLIGGGGAFEEVQALAKELGLDEHVRFTDYVPFSEVARYLSSAHICVAPEPYNDYNKRSTVIKMMEYMAIGKPVVSFDLPEHRFSAQEASLYAEPNDELDYARKVAYLMDNPAVREDMAQTGIERIQNELGWPHQAVELLAAYDMVFDSVAQADVARENEKVGAIM